MMISFVWGFNAADSTMHRSFSEVVLDASLVAQLSDMGFPLEGCRKAVYHSRGQGLEAAMNWVMEHMEDPGT